MSLQELEHFQRKLFGSTDDDLGLFYKEANMSNKDVEEVLRVIRNWYDQQEHLPKDALDDRMFVRFYIACKYSMERTKQKIDNFITIRSKAPEYYKNRDPFSRDILKPFEKAPFAFIPELTDEFYRVVCYSLTKDPTDYEPEKCLRTIVMWADIRMKCETAYGDLYVFDMTNFQVRHMTRSTPTFLKKMLFISQECYGARVKGIYLLNMPSYAANTVNLAKSLLKKKMADRIHVCSSLKELHEKIDPRFLPIELGGTKHTYQSLINSFKEAMQSDYWVNWYKLSEVQISDDSKRRDKSSNTFDEMTGIMGSFRKLDID